MSLKQTILIADDEPTIRESLAVELEPSFDVLVAKDGLEAITIYERHAERIVAVVTDLDMPRLSGRLVIEWIHHIKPQLPIIIMSGNGGSGLKDLFQQSTVSFLAKPFMPSQLCALLNNALKEVGNEAA